MQPVRLLSRIIGFGTEGYPEKVARRLRIVNIVCLLAFALIAFRAVQRLLDPDPALFRHGLIAAGVATCFATIPLLHRLNSAAALLAVIILVYVDAFRVSWEAGTGGAYWLAYFAAIAAASLLLGGERWLLSAVLAVLAGTAIIALHALTPFNRAGIPTDEFFRGYTLPNLIYYVILVFAVVQYGAAQIERAERQAETERERSDQLLANILPKAVAERLRLEPGATIAERHDEASVLFADMAGFTARAAQLSPERLVAFLDEVYSAFDVLVERHGLEKIKTSGDAYMVVSGVPRRRQDHALALAVLALGMIDAARNSGSEIRVGIASGPVVAGVVGKRRFFYDVWGDTVNLAARLEASGAAGRIQVSRSAYEHLRHAFELEARGPIDLKGLGRTETWYLLGPLRA